MYKFMWPLSTDLGNLLGDTKIVPRNVRVDKKYIALLLLSIGNVIILILMLVK